MPGKVLADLGGRPLIQHVIERTAAASLIDRVVVATTEDSSDTALAAFVHDGLGAEVYRGSCDDVLDRFYRAAEPYAPDIIVRVTADDPFKDPEIINTAVQRLLDEPGLDYCSNTVTLTFPEGLDIEAFRFAALEAAAREARLPSEREHVTPFIWKQPERFASAQFVHQEDLSAWRLTVDTAADLKLARAIVEALEVGPEPISYPEIVELLKRQPQLLRINEEATRNAGYLRSVEKEQ